MKKTIIYIAIIMMITACNDDIKEENLNNSLLDNKEIILQERDPNLPSEWTVKKRATNYTTRSVWPVSEFLGRSYTIGNSILGDEENARGPVLDFQKIKNKVRSSIAGKTEINQCVYADFDRYEKNTSFSKSVKSGFSVNLGLFKLGRERKTTEVFNTDSIKENERVYGMIDIEARDSAFYLTSTTPAALKNLASTSLSEDFMFDLYFSPMKDLLESYGPFVIIGYYAGGKATALYFGKTESTHDYREKENNIQADINASYSWGEVKKDSSNSVRLNYGFGTNRGNNTTTNNKTKKIYMQIQVRGGNRELHFNTNVNEVKETSIDLSAWLRSLDAVNTHTLVSFREEGLVGLNSFILEENFSRRMQDTHLAYFSIDAFVEPYIEIAKVYARSTVSGEKLYKIAAILNTRQGDKIVLNSDETAQATDEELRANNDIDIFQSKSKMIATEKSKYYKCAIKANNNAKVFPLLRIPLSINLKAIKESRMYKYFNETTNMCYIYDPVGLCAYSYYLDDFVLEMYGMKEWVDTLQIKPISMLNLCSRYTIIGL